MAVSAYQTGGLQALATSTSTRCALTVVDKVDTTADRVSADTTESTCTHEYSTLTRTSPSLGSGTGISLMTPTSGPPVFSNCDERERVRRRPKRETSLRSLHSLRDRDCGHCTALKCSRGEGRDSGHEPRPSIYTSRMARWWMSKTRRQTAESSSAVGYVKVSDGNNSDDACTDLRCPLNAPPAALVVFAVIRLGRLGFVVLLLFR